MVEKSITSIWEMIDFGLAGCNVDLVIENENCKVMKISDETGEGCLQMKVENGRCCCLKQGEMRIDTRVHHKGQVLFPLKHYHGITIGFQTGIAEQSMKEMMPAFQIDIGALLHKFCDADGTCILSSDASIDNLFTQLYRLPKKSQMDYFKVKVMELLIYLDGVDFEKTNTGQPYFYKSQVEKIHGIRDLIIEDLSKSYTQEELSRRFEISLTPMKQCFKSVYGKTIYQYLKEYRMNRAAEMLLTDREKKVTEIAAACGYENTGKFGQVFREQFGMAPLEYRKSNGRRR